MAQHISDKSATPIADSYALSDALTQLKKAAYKAGFELRKREHQIISEPYKLEENKDGFTSSIFRTIPNEKAVAYGRNKRLIQLLDTASDNTDLTALKNALSLEFYKGQYYMCEDIYEALKNTKTKERFSQRLKQAQELFEAAEAEAKETPELSLSNITPIAPII